MGESSTFSLLSLFLYVLFLFFSIYLTVFFSVSIYFYLNVYFSISLSICLFLPRELSLLSLPLHLTSSSHHPRMPLTYTMPFSCRPSALHRRSASSLSPSMAMSVVASSSAVVIFTENSSTRVPRCQ